MLELHNVSIGQLVRGLSLTVADGQLLCLAGAQGSGKTTLLRAVLGFIGIDGGHISIDGELLTPQSAPYFRQMTAYVPQHVTIPDGAEDSVQIPMDYVSLLRTAVALNKPLLIVDEPSVSLSDDEAALVDRLLTETAARGTTVLAVNSRILQNQIRL